MKVSTVVASRSVSTFGRWGIALFVIALPVVLLAQSRRPDTPPPPLATFEVFERTISELQDAMRAGEITSRGLVELYRARIAAYDREGPRLNAMVALNAKALEQADALDRERAAGKVRGLLHGIPIVVKDNYETVEMPTAAGSLALGSFQSDADAFQVTRLRDAGAVIIGKTNMHELASGITTISSVGGQTRNPYDLTRNPGGSSGGTGAAIAASFAAAGMGSDTCGSIRIPASHNNLVGLRGTRGLASSRGIVPLSHTQDIGGPLARTLTDLAIMLDATVGSDAQDAITERSSGHIPHSYRDALQAGGLKGARIGVLRSLFGSVPEDNEAGDIVRKALDGMKERGAELVDVSVPGLDDLLRDSGVINHEFKFDLLDYLAARPGAPVRSLDEMLKRGLYDDSMERSLNTRNRVEKRDSDDYRRALIKRDALRNAVVSAMEDQRVIALAYPTMRRKPALLGEAQPGTNCSLSANSGLPALSANAGLTDDGLPIGIELLGREWSESDLLKVAYDWEQRSARLAPFSTPPLVNGKRPAPTTWDRTSDRGGAPGVNTDLRARFTWDESTAELTYDVTVIGVRVDDVRLVALQRGESESQKGDVFRGVLFRIVEPGSLRGSGKVVLRYPFRQELTRGDLYLRAYTREHPLGAARVAIVPPHDRDRTSGKEVR
jgi:Asp-tRNA(Asn)/Glu-tRNA(Gln) amidotransferase A subunit family amidase